MANMTNDTLNVMVDEAIDKATTDALNEDTTLDRIKKWAKKHKRELIFGGVVVIVTACGIYVHKKGKRTASVNTGYLNSNNTNNNDDLNSALINTLNDIKEDHNSRNTMSDTFKKYQRIIPDGFKTLDDDIMWWVSDMDINTPICPSDFGDNAEKVVEGIAERMAKVFETIDPKDISCINIMMDVSDC